MAESTRKRLAQNTLYMYMRMVIIMIISFMTTRVLLQKIGIEDYGIYNLVGSIITIFSSLKGLFVTSTQRFLNFELGRNNFERLNTVFNMSIIANFVISLIFVFLVELLGLWFINYKINVSYERIGDVMVILHLSVVTSVIYIMTTPFEALLVAHEKISVYAYFTILDHLLKLLIIYLLILNNNKLIAYAFYLLVISFLMIGLYYVYCRKSFKESKVVLKLDKSSLKEMLSFAGWQFFGNTAFTLTHNGLNMLLNVFGGPVVNAARSIVYQINMAINQLVINVSLVLSPYSVKTYASENNEVMMRLFFISSKIMFLISTCAIIPLFFYTEEIICLWLSSVPPYAISFTKLILIWSVLRALHSPIDTLFKSVGNIKFYQLSEGVILSLPLLVSYVMLNVGCSVNVVFIVVIIFEFLNLLNIVRLAHKECELDLFLYFQKVLIPVVLCAIEIALVYLFEKIEVIDSQFVNVIIAEFLVIVSVFMYGFTTAERKMIYSIIH